jgi:hypothetical protein
MTEDGGWAGDVVETHLPEMTRTSGNPEALEKYPQGDSNPCLSRERAMS